MESGIEVSRPKGKGFRRDMFRRYKIFIDDTHVASLREGETHIIKLEPGEHRIQARIDWTGTPKVDVLVPDEIVRFVVRAGGGPGEIHQAFADPKGYLVLERA